MHEKTARRNVRLFIWFRVLFQARFYYPVLAILFLDLGLSMEEYTLLNAAWACAIVLLEVPSGALADRLGRKTMVQLAGGLMVMEMALLAFAPSGNHILLVGALLLNRILSGAAEASASGADEALAYDSLVAIGRKAEWPAVLERLMRLQSIAFVVSSLIGAAVYDGEFLRNIFGNGFWTDPSYTVRFPALLTLGTALWIFLSTLRFVEPEMERAQSHETWKHILGTGRWLLGTPLALCLIAAGVLNDSIVRLFLTLESTYFRLTGLPAAWYGVIGSAFALLGFLAAGPSRVLATRFSPVTNITIHASLALSGLLGVAMVRSPWGILFLVPLGLMFFFVSFFLSHHLNLLVDSGRRATALSFKGMAMNVAYGAAGMGFAGLVAALRGESPDDMAAFSQALQWLPGTYLIGLLAVFVLWRIKRPGHGYEPNKA
jgi:MFS family permease